VEWTLEIPAPADWITSNGLTRMSKWERAILVKAWRAATVNYAVQARLPQGLGCVEIFARPRFWGKPPVRDTENLRPTIKACVDGLGRSVKRTIKGVVHLSPGYGLIADDDTRHLPETRLRIGEPLGPEKLYGPSGILTLTITQITD
jgi:hypothetical protein